MENFQLDYTNGFRRKSVTEKTKRGKAMKLPSNFKSEYKDLKEIAYDMNILLVEDDVVVQEQVTRFLSRVFNKICVADHETAAMLKYEKNQYDIIITDLNSCKLHCIDLAKKIKWINPFQNILVFSDDTQPSRLIELINIGIDGFLSKPLEAGALVSQLKVICHKIYEYKIMQFLSDALEEENETLLSQKSELEQTLADLIHENKAIESLQEPVVQTSTRVYTDDEEAMLYTRRRKMSADEFFEVHPFELDNTNENLEDLENEFYILLSRSKEDINYEMLRTLTEIIKSFAKEIEIIPQFVQLSYGIRELSKTLDSLEDHTKLPSVMPMVASLFDNLESWRRGVFCDRDVDDIHYMDNSIISDSMSLQSFLSSSGSSSDSSSDMELF